MDDRISQLAEQKKREAAASQENLRTQEENRRMNLAQAKEDQAARRAEVQALADKFGAWARRNNVRPESATKSGVTFPTGWVIGLYVTESGEGYNYRSSNFWLILYPNGRLITAIMKSRPSKYKRLRKTYYSPKRVDLSLFPISNMEDMIAKIVSQSGKAWP